MNAKEVFRQTFSTLLAHKMRSFLTMFGIAWGIISVILLVGLGSGFSRDQAKNLKTIGTDLVVVWGGRTSTQTGGLAAGRNIMLTVDDARLIQKECFRIRNVSAELMRGVPEVSEFNAASRPVRGVWPQYQDFRSLVIAEGRPMIDQDESEANRVVVLGSEARQQLYPGKPAIGATLNIAGKPYLVIGALDKKKQNGSYGAGPDNTQLFVPYSSMARDFPPRTRRNGETLPKGFINNLAMEVGDPEEHEEAVRQVRRLLGRIHHFDPTDKDALFIWNTMEGSRLLKRVFDVMTFFFGAVAIVTLCLGGIGVMNIMLVSVTERTREIGVRKAMGATSADISKQFFTESAIITVVSGAAGLAIGLGLCKLLAMVPLPDFIPAPVVMPSALIASLITLSLITLTAGMYPAARAAELTPVECLRAE